MVVAVGGLAVVLAVGRPVGKMNDQYKGAFKEQIVVKALQNVLINMDFRPDDYLDREIVAQSELFPSFYTFNGNDYLAAEHNGIRYVQSDVRVSQSEVQTYRDDAGNSQTRTVYHDWFWGRFMVLDFVAISADPVFVYPRGRKPDAATEILTEFDAFNRKFSVVAKDATAAFRILTPPMLEGAALAADKLKCPIALAFNRGKLYVAVSNGDTLEASTGGDSTLTEQRERVAWEIQTILDMIETLYLK